MIRVSLVDDLPPRVAMARKAGGPSTTAVSAEAPRGASRGVPQKKKERTPSSQSVPAPPRPPAAIEEAVSEKRVVSREPVPEADAAPPVPQTRAPDFPATGQGNANGGDHAASDGGVAGGANKGLGLGSGTGVAGTGQGAGSGTGGGGTGSGQTTYLREHFVYIRDLISLYSSSLTSWRRQVTQGLIPRKRGPVAQKADPLIRRNAELERENARLTHKLKQAELIIDVQKKVAELLKGPSEEKS